MHSVTRKFGFALNFLMVVSVCADGHYLIEVDRILRPDGYWILSGPAINWENHWEGWDRTPKDTGFYLRYFLLATSYDK